MRFSIALTVICLATTIAGCGDGSPRNCTISGEVTVDGQPVESGSIQFKILEDGDLPGGGMILDGKYQTEVTPGKKKVIISAVDTTAEPDAYGTYPSLIPEEYTKNPQEIEVTGSATHDFHL